MVMDHFLTEAIIIDQQIKLMIPNGTDKLRKKVNTYLFSQLFIVNSRFKIQANWEEPWWKTNACKQFYGGSSREIRPQ